LNDSGSGEQPYSYQGKIVGFRIKISGTAPQGLRVKFVPWNSLPGGVSATEPFIPAYVGSDKIYLISEAWVPLDWSVTNPGARIADSLYAVAVDVIGGATSRGYSFCIDSFEPVTSVASPACSTAFRDGFESGTINNWSQTSTTPMQVTSTSPLLGSYSGVAAIGTPEYVLEDIIDTSHIRISFLLGSTATYTGTLIPAVAYLNSTSYSPIALYLDYSSSAKLPVLSPCAYVDGSTSDCSNVTMTASSARVDLEWRRGSGLTTALATMAVDGQFKWQASVPLPDETITTNGVYLGNLSSKVTGSGQIRFDDFSLQTCSP
jgi:hypothetical protein